MEILKTLLWIVQIFSALSIVVLVLLQHGKGADAGATFGAGSGSGSLFGASGAASFLSRTTAIFATVFFITTFALVLLTSSGRVGDSGVMANFSAKNNSSGAISSANASAVLQKSISSQAQKGNQVPE